MLSVICQRWWILLLKGIFAIAVGVLTVAWPGVTLLALVYLFGIFTLVDGLTAIVLGFRGESDGTVWWSMVLLGVLSAAAGIVAFAWPQITMVVLLAIIAASAFIRGFFEITAAIRLREEIDDEWILALSGLMSVLFGGLILYRPDAGLVAIVLLIGAYMMAMGIFTVALSLRLRRMQHKLSAAR